MGVTAPSFSPHQAAQAPEVTYEADEGSLWTLLLTNLGRCLGYRSQGPGGWGRGSVESRSPGSFHGPSVGGSVYVQMDTC